jgi:hypothetical protein
MRASAYLHREALGSEQWIGAGSTIWQVVDPSKANEEEPDGVVHESVRFVLKKTRCRLWALLHHYGWLEVKP